jgi:hypothetical protein
MTMVLDMFVKYVKAVNSDPLSAIVICIAEYYALFEHFIVRLGSWASDESMKGVK